jgi:hypothetical protein
MARATAKKIRFYALDFGNMEVPLIKDRHIIWSQISSVVRDSGPDPHGNRCSDNRGSVEDSGGLPSRKF